MTGQEMKELRRRHGLSQARLAELLGISRTQVSQLEREDGEVSQGLEVQMQEWALDDDETRGVEPPPDEPPAPGVNPAQTPDPVLDEDEKPKRQRRARGPQKRKLTGWQTETAEGLVALFQGTVETLEVNGEPQQIVVPGLCHLIGRFDPFDAQVVAAGMPALSVSLVKVAPRHPFLRRTLEMLTAGGDYQELAQASMAIALPIMLHHGMLGSPPQAGLNGDGPAAEPEPQP